MEFIDIIIRYAPMLILALLAVFCPSLYARLTAARKAHAQVASAEEEKNAALDDAQTAKAELDLSDTMRAAVDAAEQAYTVFDEMAKTKGLSCGAMKREHVLDKLQAYALQKGYVFDAEKWGKAIDDYVAATKRINYKK